MSIDRRVALRAAAALVAAPFVPRALACEFYAGQFTIVHPWTHASAPGDTTAIVGMHFQDVMKADRLIGVRTPVAEGGELGGSVSPSLNFRIREGQTTVMDERGPHLRLVGLKFPLEVGRTYPMSLEFAEAGWVKTELNVDYARGA
jgi:copper(I)-binding protein